MKQVWHLASKKQSFVLSAQESSLPEVAYWSGRLPDFKADGDYLLVASNDDFSGGMLDKLAKVSICPASAEQFQGQSGFSGFTEQKVALRPKFQFCGQKKTANKLTLTYADKALQLEYQASFQLHRDSEVIECSASIKAKRAFFLKWLAAPVVKIPAHVSELIEFNGRWCGEFQTERVKYQPGMRCRDNRTGRSSHENFPAVILTEEKATSTQGRTYFFHYGYSGGHKMIIEQLADGRGQVQFGHASVEVPLLTDYYSTAPLYLTYSAAGLNDGAISMQRHLRQKILSHSSKQNYKPFQRPVHYNSWEGVYFNHDQKNLFKIVQKAAEIGVERFVLDDGWFEGREDDTKALGDWVVDAKKYPTGLGPLIKHIKKFKMSFGLWLEPEMISPDSRLYQCHPDWVLGPSSQVLGRNQLVLNLALPEVQNYLFEQISNLLQHYEIEYIKWDHNRVLPFVDHRQSRALYDLLGRIKNKFQHLEIETCASGGGRVDFGIFKYASRFWLSDCNDALERFKMQSNSALFFPSLVTGSHVGPWRCHTTYRTLDISLRAWVAASRHFGFEMDLLKLSAEEVKILKKVTSWWKANRQWLLQADILRLDSTDKALLAEMQLVRDQSRFVLFILQHETSAQIIPKPLRLTKLNAKASYRLSLLNKEQIPHISRADLALKRGCVQASGEYLMNHGLALPIMMPSSILVLQGEQIRDKDSIK